MRSHATVDWYDTQFNQISLSMTIVILIWKFREDRLLPSVCILRSVQVHNPPVPPMVHVTG